MLKAIKLTFLLTIILFGSFLAANAQSSGKVSGTIRDDAGHTPLANATVTASELSSTNSDFEGDYSLDLPEGNHTISVKYLGYTPKEIKDVIVKQGQTVQVDITLSSESNTISEVVVRVSARKNTETSILNMQKNAGVLMDGLSSQSIKRAGSSDIAAAVKAVPGVSVQDGKYVYVRGLGDRYSKSILNGVDIPGLDPDKNTVQMDIFPTNI
ncbi:MAG: carboxypeptidase regulatory-like domain-containing protein, partial [Sphingobacterium sp.]